MYVGVPMPALDVVEMYTPDEPILSGRPLFLQMQPLLI